MSLPRSIEVFVTVFVILQILILGIASSNLLNYRKAYRRRFSSKRATDELSFTASADESESRLEQPVPQKGRFDIEDILDHVMDIVIVIGGDNRLLYISPSFEKVLGYAVTPALLKCSFLEVISEEKGEMAQAAFAQLRQGKEVFSCETQSVHADGHVVYLQSNAKPIFNEDGTLDRVIVVVRDISGQKKAELEIKAVEELNGKLRQSLARFSEEASEMRKTPEMEQSLLRELTTILDTPEIALLETWGFQDFTHLAGSAVSAESLTLLDRYHGIRLQVGHVYRNRDSVIVVVGETRGGMRLIRIGGSLPLLERENIKTWVRMLSRYMNIYYGNMLRIEDLTAELQQMYQQHAAPNWIIRLLYEIAEKERKKLAQELHDTVLQEQIISYRKLEMLQYTDELDAGLKSELLGIGEGLLDVIHQIRQTCNDLRPPFLKEWGLNQALLALYEQAQLRSDFQVRFTPSELRNELHDEQLIALYRINQELLNNAYKHSQATEIHISVADYQEGIRMTYSDNGVGLHVEQLRDTYHTMGISGIKERVRSLEGEAVLLSEPGKGLAVHIYLPGIQPVFSSLHQEIS